MKKSLELKELHSDTISKLEAIEKIASDDENRELTESEVKEVDTLLANADEISTKIERAEKLEKELRTGAMSAGVVIEKNSAKDLSAFSFQAAMRAAYSGKLDGAIKEFDQEARNEARYTGQHFRGIGIPSSVLEYRTAAETAAVNATEVMSFTDQLQANLVLASAGANFYSGINNQKFPVISAVNSYFVAESGGSATTPTGTASSMTLSPKKCISVVNVSNEAMTQNPGLEAALQRNMAANIAATIENALLNVADITSGPTSIFLDAGSGTPTSTAAMSGATALSLESAVLDAGVQLEGARMAYLVDGNSYAAIKVAELVSGISAAYDIRDKTINGYYAFQSSNVGADGGATKDHALFGDFSKVHIAQFGGLDMLYDPFTGGAEGEPRMIVTSLIDGGAVQGTTAFASLKES
tara:strand:+ start:157 stop:1395 length:1239 start_codon:yes stop_codon:yes gene_type:complete